VRPSGLEESRLGAERARASAHPSSGGGLSPFTRRRILDTPGRTGELRARAARGVAPEDRDSGRDAAGGVEVAPVGGDRHPYRVQRPGWRARQARVKAFPDACARSDLFGQATAQGIPGEHRDHMAGAGIQVIAVGRDCDADPEPEKLGAPVAFGEASAAAGGLAQRAAGRVADEHRHGGVGRDVHVVTVGTDRQAVGGDLARLCALLAARLTLLDAPLDTGELAQRAGAGIAREDEQRLGGRGRRRVLL